MVVLGKGEGLAGEDYFEKGGEFAWGGTHGEGVEHVDADADVGLADGREGVAFWFGFGGD